MHFLGFDFDKTSRLVHGLLVCVVRKDMVPVPVLCSPSTGQALILPRVNTSKPRVKCLLGYDPVDKQFKVLSMTQPLDGRYDMVSEEHQVLTLANYHGE